MNTSSRLLTVHKEFVIFFAYMRPIYSMSGRWAGVIVDDVIYDKEGRYRGFVVTPEISSRKAFSGEVRSPRGEFLGVLLGDNGMDDYLAGKYILRNHSVAQQEYDIIGSLERKHMVTPIQEFDDIAPYSKDHPSAQAYSDVVLDWLE